jgi:hypothetical protein
MFRSFLFLALLLCFGMVAGIAQQNGSAPSPTLMAARVNDAIKLDGVLDEPAWGDPGTAGWLVQQSPRPGEGTPYETTVRVLVTSDSLYFGFECIDPDPSRIAVHTKQRDGTVRGDDTVAIVLDPYLPRWLRSSPPTRTSRKRR